MDFDFGNRGSKLQKEQAKRREDARKQIEKERRAKEEAALLKAQLEEQNRLRRLEQARKEEEERRRAEEEQRRTGGIVYQETLQPVAAAGEGDKITLPPSALAKLSEQDAIALGPMCFEISTEKGNHHTHTGVLEFVAEEGFVGLPPKVAESLGAPNPSDPSTLTDHKNGFGKLTVKYVRLPKASFVRWTPLDKGLSQLNELKATLEENLRKHATITEGDVLGVWWRGKRFQLKAAEVRSGSEREAVPAARGGASLIDTDVEVVLDLPEEAQRAAEDSAAHRRSQTLRSHMDGAGSSRGASPEAKATQQTAAAAAAEAAAAAVAAAAGSRKIGTQQQRKSDWDTMDDSDDEMEEEEKEDEETALERHRLTKLAALPAEPAAGEADVVTCLIKTGTTRVSRRFRKTELMSVVFDFLEGSGSARPNAYRLVVPYPRRVLTPEDSASQTLSELGLTAKQEALILESKQ